MGGVFALRGTHGVPLELILQKFKETDCVVDWINYTDDAVKDGVKLSTVFSQIEAAVADVLGASHRAAVLSRLGLYYGKIS